MNKFSYLETLQHLKTNCRIYIYGSGTFGRSFLFSIKAYRPDIHVLGFMDSFRNGELFELPIVKIDDFQDCKQDYDYIIICADPMFWDEMVSKLNENNIKRHLVNNYWDFDLFGVKDIGKYEKHKHLIPEVRNLFSYEEDRLVWDKITTSMRTQNIKVLLDYCRKHDNKVDYGKYIQLNKGNVVINGGAAFGNETDYFAQQVGKNGNVYAFDPNIERDDQGENQSIINIPMALWDQTTKVAFRMDGSTSMIINHEEVNGTEIRSITIDGFVKKHRLKRLHFIKLDVEGAELNILKGGGDAIRKFRPGLAVSIYHKFEHFFQIPLFINDLVSDYIFHLDLINPFCIDTILFAVPAERQ